jgi:hypothetical protein
MRIGRRELKCPVSAKMVHGILGERTEYVAGWATSTYSFLASPVKTQLTSS